ncbi:SDR family oxidoreductase [Streptomyces sp. URMC 123]|uniref:SDR family oxidoreductase n=1 Tax=Streptomyces sp. URMC 123 TaxID=3423403 RepID=UPI003F1C6EF4
MTARSDNHPAGARAGEEGADGARAGEEGPDGGRVALVTGASRGIGYGIAEALVARGHRVCVTGRGEEALQEAVERLSAASPLDDGGPTVIGVAGKAHDEAHQAEAVERTMAAFGRLDHLVNNAGTNPVFGPLADLDLAVVRKVFETNVLSALGFAQRTWAAWQKDHGGAIVNIASIAGVNASPFVGAYGMSKAAMINLTLQLAHEMAPAVRVNAIAPAVVKTKFAKALYEGREEEAAAAYPLGRLGAPEDIGGAAEFLLSERAGWITGQTLVVDGGIFLNAGVG